MNSGIYAACAGLVARMQALDTIASNVANSSSAGFRAQKDAFGTVLAHTQQHSSMTSANRAANSFSILGGSQLDVTQGAVTHTGNDLDVAIQGSGYFKVQTAHGVQYTRNGAFKVGSNGALTTANGDPVIGASGPISLPTGPVSISGDGTISVAGAVSGKLAIVDFPAGTSLEHRGQGNYAAPGATEQAATSFALQQGALEGSNVSPVEGVVQMISAQRSAESMRHVLSMLDTDMNKTAAVDLSRVA